MHRCTHVKFWNNSNRFHISHFNFKACYGAGRAASVLLATANVSIAPALL